MNKSICDLGVDVLQSAFFINNINFSNKLDLANNFLKIINELGEAEPVVLPIPDDAPREIPRIIINTKDKKISLTISTERIDFVMKEIQLNEDNSKLDTAYQKYTNKIASTIINDLKIGVNRIAQISQFIQKPKDGVLNSFKNKINDSFMSGATELQLHRLKVIKIDELSVNHWVRLISDSSKSESPTLIINSDVNTAVAENINFLDTTKINGFFKLAIEATKKTISYL